MIPASNFVAAVDQTTSIHNQITTPRLLKLKLNFGDGLFNFTRVYDVTPFMEDHPGGDEVLLVATGKDATDDFEDVGHSNDARGMMHKYYIGEVDKATVPKKRAYVKPADSNYNHDKTLEFVIKILQFIVPLVILGLAFVVRSYTKEKSA